MGTHTGSVMTLANSIIGVSVLAMPFCFKQCGIVLSILMLMFSSIVSRLACHYLIKSAIMEKRRNFEMLAFRAFGPTGKLTVELCVIGFLLGTCVAYFVVVGDLGPAIMAPILGFQHPTALRPSVLIALGIFVVLPLGLLRNVDSLSAVSAASIAFYLCLVFKVMGEATSNFITGDWVDKVYYWRPSGVMQCIPIFSMALSCQTQLFEIFDSLPNTPIDRMNAIIKSAINMTTLFYIAVGFFGYVAFCNQSFSGNVMLSFSPTMTSDVIKVGFVLSVAVSFPLVIFPCRASIYSLLFNKGHLGQHELSGSAHIPETKFQCITLVIVTISLVTGLISPNIELVLGLVGSTIGVFICLIFPALIFISLSNRNTNERLLAKSLIGIGLVIMVLGTYTNLAANRNEQVKVEQPNEPKKIELHEPLHVELPIRKEKIGDMIRDEVLKDLKDVKELAALPQLKKEKDSPIEEKKISPIINIVEEKKKEKEDNVRQEPPIPLAPADTAEAHKKVIVIKEEKPKEEEIVPEAKKADDLIEKLKEHEEVHKKLISEGKQLLDELKKSEDELKKIETKKPATNPQEVKVVNVKTGAVVDPPVINKVKDSEIFVNKSDIVRMAEVKVPQEKKTLKEQMVKKMVEGIPLPVAIKGDLPEEKKLIEQMAAPKVEEREKRDLQEVVKLEKQEEAATPLPEIKAQKPTEPPVPVQQSDSIPPDKKEDVKPAETEENCEKTEKVAKPTESSGAKELIRTPAYLSDPKPVLSGGAVSPKGGIAGAVGEEGRPQSRDLKSVLDPSTGMQTKE